MLLVLLSWKDNLKQYFLLVIRKPLPLPEKHKHEQGQQQAMVASGSCTPSSQQMYQYQFAISNTTEIPPIHNCEPIIEMPPSPEYEYNETPNGQEDSYKDYACDLEDFAPEGVEYDAEINICSSKHVLNNNSWTPNHGKDLAVINSKCSFGQNKKLKNIGRLRTEHNA